MAVLQLVLFTLLLFSHNCAESERREMTISDGSGHITSVEHLSRSGNAATYKKGRMRCLRRRRQRLVKSCDSRMKAKEIDSEVEWKKIIGAAVVVIGLVHGVYFCHPVSYRMGRMSMRMSRWVP